MPLTPAEAEAARQEPAVYCNQAIVEMGPVIRLSFMDQSPAGSICRAAVALPMEVAAELCTMLRQLLDQAGKPAQTN